MLVAGSTISIAGVDASAKSLQIEASGANHLVTVTTGLVVDASEDDFDVDVLLEHRRNGQLIATYIDETQSYTTSAPGTPCAECVEACSGTCSIGNGVLTLTGTCKDGKKCVLSTKRECSCDTLSTNPGIVIVDLTPGDVLFFLTRVVVTSATDPDTSNDELTVTY